MTFERLTCGHCDQPIAADHERTCETCGEIVGDCDEPCPSEESGDDAGDVTPTDSEAHYLAYDD